MDNSLEKVAKATDLSSIHLSKESEHKNGNTNNDIKFKPSQERNSVEVDDKRQKMESLLRRMTERYESRTLHKSDFDSQEETKTNKLKKMIDILEQKLEKLSEGSSDKESPEDRGIQRTRTTERPAPKPKSPPTSRPIPPPQAEQGGTVWQSAMAELSDKISQMGSGIHRIDLDQMLDLDLMDMRQEEEDQKSSNSYLTGTTALPAQEQYEKKVPKRHALHPKLTYQRPEFSDVHRPSMNLKDLISRRNDAYDSPPQIKALPALIPRFAEEALYQPTSAPSYRDECPYIPRRPAQECFNAPPSECQAAGHPDSACPAGSLCCYDGCISLCWRSPHPPPKLPPLAPPPSHYTYSTPQPPPVVYSTPQPPPHDYSTPQPPPLAYTTPRPLPQTYSTPSPHPNSYNPSTIHPPVPSSTPSHSPINHSTPKDPLFYQPAPPDFLPKVGPAQLPPSIPQYQAPKYRPASDYRPSPKPQYAPPIPQYEAPLGNNDGIHHPAGPHIPVHQVSLSDRGCSE